MGLPIAAPLMAYMYPLIDTIDGNPNILSWYHGKDDCYASASHGAAAALPLAGL